MGDFPGPAKDSIDFAALVQASILPPTVRKPLYTPKRARARHRMIAMLHEVGWTNKDIAKATGYTESRISTILNSHHPDLVDLRTQFASRVADQVTNVQSRIQLYANEMVDVMVHHARDTAEKTNSRLAARDMLHMAGFSPVKRELQLRADVPHEELQTLMGRIQEAHEVKNHKNEWVVRNGTSG